MSCQRHGGTGGILQLAHHVHIGKLNDAWCVWLMPGVQWTEVCLRVGSLAEGAKLAREWIEERLRSARLADVQ